MNSFDMYSEHVVRQLLISMYSFLISFALLLYAFLPFIKPIVEVLIEDFVRREENMQSVYKKKLRIEKGK